MKKLRQRFQCAWPLKSLPSRQVTDSPLMVHMEISSQAAESAVDARVECREQFRTSGTKMEIIKMTTGMLQWSYQWFAA